MIQHVGKNIKMSKKEEVLNEKDFISKVFGIAIKIYIIKKINFFKIYLKLAIPSFLDEYNIHCNIYCIFVCIFKIYK